MTVKNDSQWNDAQAEFVRNFRLKESRAEMRKRGENDSSDYEILIEPIS
jgi:hypothetical protein